jgi:hypothetical protein
MAMMTVSREADNPTLEKLIEMAKQGTVIIRKEVPHCRRLKSLPA